MRPLNRASLLAASLALAASISVGCATRPVSKRQVDPSVLPASAKAMLSQDAQVTRVDEVMYTKGTKIYLITYNVDGREQKIAYNTRDESTPTGVFEFGVGGSKPATAQKRAEAVPDSVQTPSDLVPATAPVE